MRISSIYLAVALGLCVSCAFGAYWSPVGQWNMDSTFTTTSRTFASDLSGSGNHLSLSNSSNTASRYPAFTTGNGGYAGEALSFDGSDDMCYTPFTTWGEQESLRIEMWFKAETDRTQTLLSVNTAYPWEIRLSSTAVTFYPWFRNSSDDSSAGVYNPAAVSYVQGEWNHIVAEVLDGQISLTVNSGSSTRSYNPDNLYLAGSANYVVMGCSQAGTRHFDGLIDEVLISTYIPEPATLVLLALGGITLRRRRR